MRQPYIPMVRYNGPFWRRKALTDPFYGEVLALRDRFIELGLDSAESDKWRIINDYLRFKEAGCETRGMQEKCREFLIQFGPHSIFYSTHQSTKLERRRYTQRIFFICRKIQKLKDLGWPNLSRADVNVLSMFRMQSIKLVRWLVIRPLTHAQKERVWVVEHMLGIWWSDLTDQENGMKLEPMEVDNE